MDIRGALNRIRAYACDPLILFCWSAKASIQVAFAFNYFNLMTNDPKDRHVIAVAVKCGAEAIVRVQLTGGLPIGGARDSLQAAQARAWEGGETEPCACQFSAGYRVVAARGQKVRTTRAARPNYTNGASHPCGLQELLAERNLV
jgi:hypothetical protein